MPRARRGERELGYTVTGDGAPLVLVPGIGGGARLFGTLPRRFARAGFAALAFDPVGVAPSSPHRGAFSFEAAASDLLAVLDDADFDRCHLVATSLGGKVALQLAGLAPARIDRLVLLASSAVVTPRARRVYKFFELVAERLPADAFGDAIAPFLFGRGFHARHAEVVDDIVRAIRPTDAVRALIVAQARALQGFDGTGLARALRCPTLCVAGTEDTLTLPDEVRATAALIAGAELVEVAAGHSLLLESAEVFRTVTGWLDPAAPQLC